MSDPTGDQSILNYVVGILAAVSVVLGAAVKYTNSKYAELRQAFREHIDTERYDSTGRDVSAENFRKEIKAEMADINNVIRTAHAKQYDMISAVNEGLRRVPDRDELFSAMTSIKNDLLAMLTINDRRNTRDPH